MFTLTLVSHVRSRSRVVAERWPGSLPVGAEPGGQVDPRALLVVGDADAVVEDRDQPDGCELAPQQPRVDVHRDRGGRRPGRRGPQPEAVGAAVHLRQAVAWAVSVDGAGLAVVAGEHGGVRAQPRLERAVL